jgi:hypothetical protein
VNFFTVSGEAATRSSPSRRSFGMAIFMPNFSPRSPQTHPRRNARWRAARPELLSAFPMISGKQSRMGADYNDSQPKFNCSARKCRKIL